MFSPPIPQIPNSAVTPIPTSKVPLEFTKDELPVVKKWLKLYNDERQRLERFEMLRSKILPRLYLFNKLPEDAWRHRKGVSTQ
jgi:hypothetical protein